MRASLERSLAVHGASRAYYDRGSIVVCTSCARPLYRLERGIALGEKTGRSASAFAPVTVRDLQALLDRPEVDAGVRALILAADSLPAYAATISRPTTGQPALCPFCDQVFVQGRTVEEADTIDRAFVWELVVIPPSGPFAGLVSKAGNLWRHV